MNMASVHTARYCLASRSRIRRVVARLIALALLDLLLLSSPGVFASPLTSATLATGMIRVSGIVTVDGVRAASGQTIFPGNHIVTAGASESIIDLEKFSRLRLSPETELTLDFSRINISGSLSKGVVRGFIPIGIPASIKTAGAELLTDSSQPTVFNVQVEGETTRVSVEKGRVDVRSGSNLRTVYAGEVFATDSSAQPSSPSSLSNRQKGGLFAAIGAAAVFLAIAIIGREEPPEEQFGNCVIILSGSGSSCR